MDKPKCKLCGERHWGGCRTAAETPSAAPKPKRPAKPGGAPAALAPTHPAAHRKTAVYRHFDAAGQLLYVGASHSPAKRTSEQRQTDWWQDVARTEVVYVSTRAEALAAESAAVAAEDPHHNKQLKKQAIAPPGVCPYCDARRFSIAAAVARHRARKLLHFLGDPCKAAKP